MSFKNIKALPQSFGSKVRNLSQNARNTSSGFLSRIFLKTLEKRLGTDINRVDQERTLLERWNALVNAYLRDPKNSVPQNNEGISAARGNLTKELLKPGISWKVFIKGLRLMQVVRIDFYFRFHIHNATIIEHYDSMNLGDAYIHDPNDDEFIIPVESAKEATSTDSGESIQSEAENEIPASTVPEDILC